MSDYCTYELVQDLLDGDGNVVVEAGEILIKYDFSAEFFHVNSGNFVFIAEDEQADYLE